MTSKTSKTRDESTIGISSTTSKKTSTRETRPNPTKKSTKQEREDIAQFLRQRMSTKGSLPPGTINEAAKHFGRNRHMIGEIYKELKPKSLKQRVLTDQERQDVVNFLRQRMSAGGLLPSDTINEAAQHFGRHRRTIERIYKELKPKSANDRLTRQRRDIVLFLRQRMNAKGSLPPGTINEAAKHFGRNRHMIGEIYKELKPKSLKQRVLTDQERQDIVLFLRQRMKADGSLHHGTISEAVQHFGRHRETIRLIYKELKTKNVVYIDEVYL
jgi:DNA-binding transcriptional regulator YhcF (GntR family)